MPVDYRQARGDHLELALARLPATDPAHRIGSLVVNFGGPGYPGTQTLRVLGRSLPAPVRARFDIVSFDPRGTGSSQPIDCVDDATYERLLATDPTPDSVAELPAFYGPTLAGVDVAQACIDRHGSWLARVGSRNVARDLDRIRAALGDPKLTYLGFSYGTVIGAAYAQMFPRRVRALVLDSAVDLSASPESERHATLMGFEHALELFLDACAGQSACSSGLGSDPRGALMALRAQFEAGATLPAGDGRVAGATSFYLAIAAALYDRANGWPALAQALTEARDGRAHTLQLLADGLTGRNADGTYNNLQEVIGIIRCADRRDPYASYDEFRAGFDAAVAEFPFFGPFFASSPLGCDPRLPRPRRDDLDRDDLGDVRSVTAPGALIIGTTDDPATPYAGALDLRRRLRGSRLVTFDSVEHGAYAGGVACIDHYVNLYLLERILPRRGARCSP